MTIRQATENETRAIGAKLRSRGLHSLATDFETGRMTFTALDGVKLTTGSLTASANATAISHGAIAAEVAASQKSGAPNRDREPTADELVAKWGTFKPAEPTTERASGAASSVLQDFIDDDAPLAAEPAILRRHMPGSTWAKRNAPTRGTTGDASSALLDFIGDE